MDINTLLSRLADEHISDCYGARPEAFHRVGDLTTVSHVVFSSPDADEWCGCGEVPPGTHPVHAGVVRRHDHETGDEFAVVTMALIPLAEPEVIAAAAFEDAIEDHLPVGPHLAFLWDSTAMDALRFDGPRPEGFEDLDAFVAHVEAELAAVSPASAASPASSSGAVPWVDVVVNPETGCNVLAFPVCAEGAGCLAGRDADGKLVALLFTATM